MTRKPSLLSHSMQIDRDFKSVNEALNLDKPDRPAEGQAGDPAALRLATNRVLLSDLKSDRVGGAQKGSLHARQFFSRRARLSVGG